MTRQSRYETSAPIPRQAITGPLFSLEHVSFRYPHEAAGARPALDDITLDIQRGEYLALLGHNGSGKSTLGRMLNGLLLPTTGSVLVAGMDTQVASARGYVRELVGMIFSDPDNQIIATQVEDDVGWGLAARGLERKEITARVEAALEAVGMTHAKGRAPYQLSGGQRQRLAIAGVLALEPACIVADEPTAQLDPQARLEVTGLLRQLHRERGLTIVHVTHLLEEAALADRIVVLEGGRVAMTGAPATVFADLDRLRALRLTIPDMALLGERLRALGVAVPPQALTPDLLVAALEGQP